MLIKLDEVLLSDNVVERFHNSYQQSEFKNWIISILPEIEDCINTKQDNPWHIYNCLDHILHSIEEINKQTKNLDLDTRRMLAYTMLLHDMGKPESKIRRYSKFYGREVDSFFNHNIASVKISERVLDCFKFNPRQKNMILKLVKEHDAFMHYTLDTSIDINKQMLTVDVINDIVGRLDIDGNGLQMLEYIVMIARSDSLAQNPKMTQQALKLVDSIKQFLHSNQL